MTDTTGAALERYAGPNATIALANDAWKLAQTLQQTDFVPKALRGKPEAILAAILTGAEVGISPMQALAKIHVIEGRPAMSAELMRAVVLRDGHDLWIEEQSSTRVIIGGKRKGSDRETRVTWTMDDAKRANLAGKDVWRKYPTAMLTARATGQLCRAIFADVLSGISYTVEELEDGDLIEVEEVPVDAPAPPPGRTARARRPATRGSGAPAQTEPDPAPPVEREAPPLPGEGDDEPVDAELVGPDGEVIDDGPLERDPDPPPAHEGARTYSPGQIIAIRIAELGLDRDAKIALCSAIVGRDIDTTKDLAPDEVTTILETISADGFDPADYNIETETAAAAPAEDRPPQPPRRRRVAAPGPSGPVRPPATSWTGDDWRTFLSERGVKVTEVLREAARVAGDYDDVVAPTTLDEITGSGIEAVLVGYVEDLSLERAKQ